MKIFKWFVFIILILLFNFGCDKDRDIVYWCPIKMDKEAKEVKFVAVYKFTVRDSKPDNIKKVRNPVLNDDDDFIKCISGWLLPSIKGEGVAEFFFEHGLVEIDIHGKGFYKEVTRDQNDGVRSK
jgi:hypothetical protein